MSRVIAKSVVHLLRINVPRFTRGPEKLCLIQATSRFCTIMGSSKAINKLDAIINPLVWIDMEMTGLEVMKDKIMEIAVLITDGELNIVAEGPNLVVHQDDQTLENMHEWCVAQHGKTGLTQACRESKVGEAEAEEQVMSFLSQHLRPGTAVLAGNSVYQDRKFLTQYMPRIDQFLHYRIVDVSSVKELCKSWFPEEYSKVPRKGGNHRAMDDIQESVKELCYYRQAVFKERSK